MDINWVISTFFLLLIGLVGYLGKITFTQVLSKIDIIIEELKLLGKTSTSQEERIKYQHEIQLDVISRLNSHSERLFRLESKEQ